MREIVHELSSGMAAELGSYFSSLGPGKASGLIHGSHCCGFPIQSLSAFLYHLSDGDVEALLEKASPENKDQYSSIEPSGDSPKAKCAGETDLCVKVSKYEVNVI